MYLIQFQGLRPVSTDQETFNNEIDVLLDYTVPMKECEKPLPSHLFLSLKEFNLDHIKTIVEPYAHYLQTQIQEFRTLSKELPNIAPGDIMYYNLEEYGFIFGHLSIALGSQMVYDYNNSDTYETPVNSVYVYRAENVSLGTYTFNNSYDCEQGSQFHKNVTVTATKEKYKIGFDFNPEHGYITPLKFKKNQKDGKGLGVIRYQGPKQQQVRAAAALISYYMIKFEVCKFGGFLYLLFNRCHQVETAPYLEQYKILIRERRLECVCSGFSILSYQLALEMMALDVNVYLPMDALSARPSHMVEFAENNPHWGYYVEYGYNNKSMLNYEHEKHNNLYPLMHTISILPVTEDKTYYPKVRVEKYEGIYDLNHS